MSQLCSLSEESIRSAVDAIVSDPSFKRSNQCVRLLTYLVDEALSGNSQAIKEITIAHAVFGKPTDFQGASDNVVRVNAARLRKALQRYYDENGAQGRINISLPLGSYKPSFELIAESIDEVTDVQEECSGYLKVNAPEVAISRLRSRHVHIWMPILLFSIGMALYLGRSHGHTQDQIAQLIFLERTEPLDQSQALREMALMAFHSLAARLQTMPDLAIIDGVHQNSTATANNQAQKEYRLRTFVRSTTDGARLDWEFEDELTSQIIRTGEVAITDDLGSDHRSLTKGTEFIVDQLPLPNDILLAKNTQYASRSPISEGTSSIPLR